MIHFTQIANGIDFQSCLSRSISEIGKGDQKLQTSRYKISKSWGCNIQHGDYSLIIMFCIFESC